MNLRHHLLDVDIKDLTAPPEELASVSCLLRLQCSTSRASWLPARAPCSEPRHAGGVALAPGTTKGRLTRRVSGPGQAPQGSCQGTEPVRAPEALGQGPQPAGLVLGWFCAEPGLGQGDPRGSPQQLGDREQGQHRVRSSRRGPEAAPISPQALPGPFSLLAQASFASSQRPPPAGRRRSAAGRAEPGRAGPGVSGGRERSRSPQRPGAAASASAAPVGRRPGRAELPPLRARPAPWRPPSPAAAATSSCRMKRSQARPHRW